MANPFLKKRVVVIWMVFFGFVIGLEQFTGAINNIDSDLKVLAAKLGLVESKNSVYPVLLKATMENVHKEESKWGRSNTFLYDAMITYDGPENLVFDKIYIKEVDYGLESSWPADSIRAKAHYSFEYREFSYLEEHLSPPLKIGANSSDGPLRFTFELYPMVNSTPQPANFYILLGYQTEYGERGYLPVVPDEELTEAVLKRGFIRFPVLPKYDYRKLYLRNLATTSLENIEYLAHVSGESVDKVRQTIESDEFSDAWIEEIMFPNLQLSSFDDFEYWVGYPLKLSEPKPVRIFHAAKSAHYEAMLTQIYLYDEFRLNEYGKITGEKLSTMNRTKPYKPHGQVNIRPDLPPMP